MPFRGPDPVDAAEPDPGPHASRTRTGAPMRNWTRMRRAEEDVAEAETWCDVCEEERRFVMTQVDVAEQELAAEVPDVGQAISGEPGWVCTVCGSFRRNLVADEAYDYDMEHATGMRVRAFVDGEDTYKEQSETVTPADRVGLHTVRDEEGRRVVDEEEHPPRRPPGTDG